MSQKMYLSAQGLLEDAFRLGVQVVRSGYRPTVIIAIWRGGTPIGIAVQELLDYAGIETDHIAIRTSSYASGIDDRRESIRIHGLNYLVKRIRHRDRLLIVDDVFDTGYTIEAVIEELRSRARRNMPKEVRVAVPYYKPGRNETDRVPDFFLHETGQWIKFPHSLEGLSDEEIREHRPAIHTLLKEADTGE